jgi:hypothetical protein
MWTIETGLLNAEILTQLTKTDTSDPNIHLTMAFRSLTDDSRSLVLANRYEARLQRLYDRAYKTLRELQQTRKSEPTPPHTIHIKWVKPNEDPDQPADQHPTSDTQPQSYNPSVSEGSEPEWKAEPDPPAELRNEPTATPGSYSPSVSAGDREKPNAAPETELRNEPTTTAINEVSSQTKPLGQPFVPIFQTTEPPTTPSAPNPTSAPPRYNEE